MILLRLTSSEDFVKGKKYKVISQVAGFEEMYWVKNEHSYTELVDYTNDDWRIYKKQQSLRNKRK